MKQLNEIQLLQKRIDELKRERQKTHDLFVMAAIYATTRIACCCCVVTCSFMKISRISSRSPNASLHRLPMRAAAAQRRYERGFGSA